ncbi:MAG: DUF1800 domain-containing protein [Saprospiraceae bacterium]|nr:DUF1800 domain-containing protein [Candidatus Defluviibacterium haderslevense]
MPNNTCLKGGLQPYVPSPEKPWDERRIHHLYNKLSNGAPINLINAAKANTPSKIIDYLFTTALSHPLPGEIRSGVKTIDYSYPWKEQDIAEDPDAYYKYLELVHMWFNGMVTEGLRHKLVLFWSNHFVTTSDATGNRPTWVFQYYWILHNYALGNFKEFVKAIGLTPAMLIYLDGRYNYAGNPNENYARELMELFTMGVGNYTEKDIAEVARSLTGWNILYYEKVAGSGNYFVGPLKVGEYKMYRYNHDWKNKNIFGKSVGNFGGVVPADDVIAATKAKTEYDSLHDVIFDVKKREIATFICKKLYKFYLYNDPPTDIINGLADVFIASSFDITTVLKTLFKSEHFFDDASIGISIKSHIDNQIHFFRSLDLEPGKDYYKYKWINGAFKNEVPDPVNYPNAGNRDALSGLYYQTANLGQTLFNPINVAGWPGHRAWLNEFTLVNRWRYNRDQFDYYLYYDWTKEKYRSFLKSLTNNSTDPDFIVRKVLAYFITIDMPIEIVETAVGVFKATVPANYFLNGTWNLDYNMVPRQFMDLMKYIITLPEYQLL